jgi:YegS/Rv2252/BmrU family lipid kinase
LSGDVLKGAMQSSPTSRDRLSIRIIANPISGNGRGAEIAKALEKHLLDGGGDPSLFFTESAGDARREAQRSADAAAVVVSVGGDGTVNEVANGLLGSATRLALYPTGTANVLAKEFGIRGDLAGVAQSVFSGKTVPLDVGRFQDRVFLCMAGVGFDAAVASRYAERRKGTGSFANYAIPLFQVFGRFRAPALEIEVDGKRLRHGAAWALVTNTRSYGGPLGFCESADPTDGILDLTLIRHGGRSRILRYLLLSLMRRFDDPPDTLHVTGRRFTVRPRHGPVGVQLDGDFAGHVLPDRPGEFEVVPAGIHLTIPGDPAASQTGRRAHA